jgi:[ribosomal protein S18]-alanine N-acetyltransferase
VSARSGTFVVRTGMAGDAAAVHALEVELFGADAWSADAVAEALGGGDRHTVVAEAEDRVTGYAVHRVSGDVADLERVGVHPGLRRSGLGSALLAAVRAQVGVAAERLLLEVREDNVGARAFYAAHGAVEIDRRRRYYRDGSDALVLQLRLGPDEEEADRD